MNTNDSTSYGYNMIVIHLHWLIPLAAAIVLAIVAFVFYVIFRRKK